MSNVSIDQIRALRAQDLNQLSLLLALLRTCSVSETARQLGVAQPSVSRSLERLRHTFDDRLLVRHGNDMARTTRGESLLPQLERLFSELNSQVFAREPANPASAARTLTIACNDYLQAMLAPAMQKQFARLAPLVKLRFTAPGHTRYGAIVDSGHADFVIGGECSAGELRTQQLFEEHFVGIVDRANTRVKKRLSFKDFCALRHVDHSPTGTYAIPALLDRRTAELGGKRDVAIVVTSAPAIVDMLVDTQMVSIWYSNVARVLQRQGLCEAVRLVPLGFDFVRAPVVLCWGNQSHDDAFLTWARGEIVKVAVRCWAADEGRAEEAELATS